MDIVEYYRRKARGLDLPSIKQSIERHLQPDHDRECDVEEIRLYLENVVKAMPGLDESQVILFGSRRSNVMTGDSDADFCLLLPIGIKLDDVDDKIDLLFEIQRALIWRRNSGRSRLIEWTKVVAIGKTKGGRASKAEQKPQASPEQKPKRAPPIMKLTSGQFGDRPSLEIDLCVDNVEGPLMSEIVRMAKALGGATFQAFFCTLKKFCKEMGVLDSMRQYPSPTVLFLMVIWYAQRHPNPLFEFVDVGALRIEHDLLRAKVDAYGGLEQYVEKSHIASLYGQLDRRFDQKDLADMWRMAGNSKDALWGPDWDGAGLRPREVLVRVPYGEAEKDPRTVRDHMIAFGEKFTFLSKLPNVMDVAQPFNDALDSPKFRFDCEKLVQKEIPLERMKHFAVAIWAVGELLKSNPDFDIDPLKRKERKKTGKECLREKQAAAALAQNAAMIKELEDEDERKRQRRREKPHEEIAAAVAAGKKEKAEELRRLVAEKSKKAAEKKRRQKQRKAMKEAAAAANQSSDNDD